MKIQVCGCSYFTPDPKYPNTHFTEIVAEKLNADLINLAECGSSNFGIRLQVQSWVEFKPDLIILGFTSPDRLDYMFKDKDYNPRMHVHNLKYIENREFIKNQCATIKSDPIPWLINSHLDLAQGAKDYVKYFYNYNLQRHKDYLIAQTALYFLKSKGIPFVFSEGGLGDDNLGLFKEFKENCIKLGNPWKYTSKDDTMWQRTYHTDSRQQVKLAEIWSNKIQSLM